MSTKATLEHHFSGTNEPIAIDDLAGVWKRTLLIEADGRRDDTSSVYWLQIGDLCGDIRVGDFLGASDVSAFAGRLVQRDGIFRWLPDVSLGVPDGAPPDEGTLRWEHGLLREDGVHRPYKELWERIAAPGPDDRVVRLPAELGVSPVFLFHVGTFGFCVAGPAADPVFTLVERAGEEWSVRLTTDMHLPVGTPFAWMDAWEQAASAATGAGAAARSFTGDGP